MRSVRVHATLATNLGACAANLPVRGAAASRRGWPRACYHGVSRCCGCAIYDEVVRLAISRALRGYEVARLFPPAAAVRTASPNTCADPITAAPALLCAVVADTDALVP